MRMLWDSSSAGNEPDTNVGEPGVERSGKGALRGNPRCQAHPAAGESPEAFFMELGDLCVLSHWARQWESEGLEEGR